MPMYSLILNYNKAEEGEKSLFGTPNEPPYTRTVRTVV